MNIDERLDRLAQRHEALAQSVEMMLASQREQAAEHNRRFKELTSLVDRVVGTVERLAEIAANHERRIEGLEGGRPS